MSTDEEDREELGSFAHKSAKTHGGRHVGRYSNRTAGVVGISRQWRSPPLSSAFLLRTTPF